MAATSSWRSPLTTATERLAVGQVAGVKGLRGQLRVEPLTDRPERLQAGAEVFLDGEPTPRRIVAAERSANLPVLTLAGVESREQAEALVGRYLEVPQEALPPGMHYWHELVGVEVRDQSGRPLGLVAEVFRAGENEVYRVVGDAGETLVPALREVVTELDVPGRRMVVHLDVEEVR